MAIITRFFKENAGKAAGAAAAMGSLGGMLLPWLQGVILERLGTGASAGFTGGAALVMAALALALFTRPGASPAARRRTVRLEES
jgi:nitrate/nitrite transporter NarK